VKQPSPWSRTDSNSLTRCSAMNAAWSELERAAHEHHYRETNDAALSKFELALSSKSLAVRSLDLSNTINDDGDAASFQSQETFLLEILEEWKNLVSELTSSEQTMLAFTPYVLELTAAFHALTQTDRLLYRHLKSLVSLLAQTAAEFQKRRSDEGSSFVRAIKCRFVTLLEVLLSYSSAWTGPSDKLSRIWLEHGKEAPAKDTPPVNFRRKAYRVLVSLPWVPSSRGLLEACSFEARRQAVDVEKSPPKVKEAVFDKIRGSKPQPRFDCVNQVLDRLKDDDHLSVAIISEKRGMGKTTLAALVASHPSVLQLYRVIWLSLPVRKLTYSMYTKCLDDVCQQLSLPSLEWPECVKRCEEPAFRDLREEAAMGRARDLLAKTMLDRDENYLLILDGVDDDNLVDLFRFSGRLSIVATTQNRSLEGVNWTLDLGPMSEDELIDLFLTEAGFALTHMLSVTSEVRQVVRLCEYHPLMVRTVGRWYGLKQVTAGIVEGMDELLKDLSSLAREHSSAPIKTSSDECSSDNEDDTTADATDSEGAPQASAKDDRDQDVRSSDKHDKKNEEPIAENGDTAIGTETTDDLANSEPVCSVDVPMLFEILRLVLEPANIEGNDSSTVLFTLCLSSMAVVFPGPVPLDSVILLWEQLLLMEPCAINEISQRRDPSRTDILKRAWIVAEGLAFMGIISVADRDGMPWVEFHHVLYRDIGKCLVRETSDLGAETYERTTEEWNKAFVMAYFTHRLERTTNGEDDSSWEYAMEKLPSHIFQAKMSPMAETILGEEQFFRARIDAHGWNRAIEMQVDDCIKLQQALENEDDSGAQGVSSVFNTFGSLVNALAEEALGLPEDSLVTEISRAVFKIGFALASHGYYDDAVEHFERAQALGPNSPELLGTILYSAGWALYSANANEKALRKLKTCRKVMEDFGCAHVLYYDVLLLQGEVFVGECEYREAESLYEQVIRAVNDDELGGSILLGNALSHFGRLLYCMGDTEKSSEVFKQSLNRKLEIGETSADLSFVLGLLGDIYMEKRDASEAGKYYERALQILDALKYDQEAIEYLVLRGKLDYIQSDFATSLESLECAHRAITESPKFAMDQSAYDLRCVARCYYIQGELEAASSVLQDSLVLTNERPFSLERSFGLHDLAQCILGQKMAKEGLVCLEQALEIRILKLGECALVSDTFSIIGRVHMDLGTPDEALPIFEKVYDLTTRISPNDTERIAQALYCVGDANVARKQYAKAKPKLRESMALLKDGGFGDDSPGVARVLQRLGDIEAAEKHYKAAFNFFGQALRIRQMHSDKRDIAETLHGIGVLARKQGNLDPALDSLQEALATRKELANPRETASTLLEVGNVLRLQSKSEDAVRCYEEAIDLLDANDEIRASLYLALGHAKLSLKRDGEVLSCYESALAIRTARYGRDNMKTANVHRSLGLFQYLVHHGDESLLHLNEYMRVIELDHQNQEGGDDDLSEEDGGDDDDNDEGDVEYVLAVILMCDIHKASGRESQAKNLIELAKEVCDESDEILRDKPVLIDMVERRRSPPEEAAAPTKRVSILQRLKLSEEAGAQLSVTADDAAVLRNMGFVDD